LILLHFLLCRLGLLNLLGLLGRSLLLGRSRSRSLLLLTLQLVHEG
jgi:hypothetical protein